MRRGIAFAPRYNSEGKKDATGAFHPRAREWVRQDPDNRELVLFDNRRPMARRAKEVLVALGGGPYEDVAFFCHGYLNGIQAGFRSRGLKNNLRELVGVLGKPKGGHLTVYLFACDTAKGYRRAPGGDGGFADLLRDLWSSIYSEPEGLSCPSSKPSITVYAHATPGHTTNNPFLRVFRSPAGEGGEWVITPPGQGGRAGEWRLWKSYLRNGGWLRLEDFGRENP